MAAPAPSDFIVEKHFKEVPSTHTTVEELCDSFDDTKLTVVSADFQTAGRGTGDRAWEAKAGSSAMMTFYFRFPPDLPTSFVNANAPSVTRLLAFATRGAFQEVAGGFCDDVGSPLSFRLKWPNDVILQRCKIAGVLARAITSSSGRLDRIIISVGANINNSAEELQAIQRAVWPAASLFTATGRRFDVPAFRRRITEKFAGLLPEFFVGGYQVFMDRIDPLELLAGVQVRFRVGPGQEFDCVFKGVDKHGHVSLWRLDTKTLETYPSGEIVQ